MRRFWFLAIALVLLWLDIFILSDRRYPDYEYDYEHYGRKTQDFVDHDVVGEYMPVDVVSDLPGILILLGLVLAGGPAVCPTKIEYDSNGKRRVVKTGKLTRLGERFWPRDLTAVLFLLLSGGAIVVKRLLPFWVNGVPRYAGEYLTHLADVLLPLVAVFMIMAEWSRRTDIRTTHRESDVISLLMMVSLFGGFFSRFAYLYGFRGIHLTAWLIEGFLMFLALFLLFVSMQENARKIGEPDEEMKPDENEDPFEYFN